MCTSKNNKNRFRSISKQTLAIGHFRKAKKEKSAFNLGKVMKNHIRVKKELKHEKSRTASLAKDLAKVQDELTKSMLDKSLAENKVASDLKELEMVKMSASLIEKLQAELTAQREELEETREVLQGTVEKLTIKCNRSMELGTRVDDEFRTLRAQYEQAVELLAQLKAEVPRSNKAALLEKEHKEAQVTLQATHEQGCVSNELLMKPNETLSNDVHDCDAIWKEIDNPNEELKRELEVDLKASQADDPTWLVQEASVDVAMDWLSQSGSKAFLGSGPHSGSHKDSSASSDNHHQSPLSSSTGRHQSESTYVDLPLNSSPCTPGLDRLKQKLKRLSVAKEAFDLPTTYGSITSCSQ